MTTEQAAQLIAVLQEAVNVLWLSFGWFTVLGIVRLFFKK